MKKNGFIATSILYSFFLVFITLFVALITNYLQNKVLLDAIDDIAKETVYSINNLKFTDLEIGNSITFANIPSSDSSYSYLLNSNAKWIVGDIKTSGNTKTYYLLSDFTAQNQVITRRLPSDSVTSKHFVTLDVMTELADPDYDNGYKNDIYFYQYGSSKGLFTKNDFKIYVPTASKLSEIRNNSNITEDIKDAILGVDGDYAVNIDGTYGEFSNPDLTKPYYVLLKRYNFSMAAQQGYLVPKYCNSSYDGTKVTYSDGTNGFGYTHVVDESVNKSGTLGSYVDYCLYAKKGPYSYPASELVVTKDVVNATDTLEETFRSVTFQYRLMAEIKVNVDSDIIYLAGGRGTAIDPYLITNGVKLT